MAENNSKSNYIFYDSVTSISNTTNAIFSVISDASEMNIVFDCTGTFEAKVYASIFNKNNMKPYPVYKLPDYTMVSSITDGSYMYNIDLSGIDYLKVELVSLTGTITVSGKAVG